MGKRVWPLIIGSVFLLAPSVAARAQPAETCVLGASPPAADSGSGEDGLHAATQPGSTPHAGLHGQLMFGSAPSYLNHLPVFMGHPDAHPHNFQVILEVAFAISEDQERHREDAAANPESIYTAVPPVFDQFWLTSEDPAGEMLRAMPGTAIVRGHFEQDGQIILDDVTLEITRIIHFREFQRDSAKLETQHYIVYGHDGAAYMSHLISAPPDFDQTLAVGFTAEDVPTEHLQALVDALLAEGLYMELPDRANDVTTRLLEGEVLTCSLDTETRALPITVEVRIDSEIYCEQGELSALVIDQFNMPQRCSE